MSNDSSNAVETLPETEAADASHGKGSTPAVPWRWLLGALWLLVGIALVATFYFAKAVLFPITLALLLNLILSPVVAWLNRWRVPNVVGAIIILSVGVSAVALGAASLLGPAAGWIERAPESFREIEWKLRSIRKPIENIGAASEQVDEITKLDGGERPLKVEVQQPGVGNTVLNTTGGFLAGGLLSIVLLFFLLASGDSMLTRLVEMMPTWREKRQFVQLAKEIREGISRYLLMTTAINLFLGLAIGLSMWLIGLPNPALWGMMAAVFNFVPFVGAAFGAAVVFFVALLEFDTIGQAALAPLFYIGINIVEANFVTPYLIGRSVRLSPVMILIFLALWGWMWGVGGAVIAVPLLAVCKIFCDNIDDLKPVGRFLGG